MSFHLSPICRTLPALSQQLQNLLTSWFILASQDHCDVLEQARQWLGDSTIHLAFQIHTFSKSGPSSERLGGTTKRALQYIVDHSEPPVRAPGRPSRTSRSAEPPVYPVSWVTDKSTYRRAVQSFNREAESLIRLDT